MPAVLIDIESRFAKALDGIDRVAKAGEQTGRRLDAAFSTAKAGISGLVGALSVDALVSNGMDEIEIPAFLRRQAD